MTKSTAAWIGFIGAALCAAIVTTGTSTRAASPPNPTPVVSVTTLPALPSPSVPTAHPVTSPAPSIAPTPPPQPLLTPVPPPPGSLITITGRVARAMTVTLDQLRAMRPVSLTMRVIDADGKHRFHIFSGAALPELIDRAQALTFGGTQNATAAWVVVSGVANGPAVVAFPEFESDHGGHRVILAYTVDGKSFDPGVMLVIEGDATTKRFVRGVTRIDVQEAPR